MNKEKCEICGKTGIYGHAEWEKSTFKCQKCGLIVCYDHINGAERDLPFRGIIEGELYCAECEKKYSKAF